MIARVVWPTAELPEIIDSWMRTYTPDLVVLHVNAYWYLYRSTPLLLQRRLGRFGRAMGNSAAAVGRTRWIARTAPFQLARRLALATIGGATYFTATGVCDVMEACALTVASHEQAGLVVRVGDGVQFGAQREAVARVHRRLGDFCAQHHVSCVAGDERAPKTPPADY